MGLKTMYKTQNIYLLMQNGNEIRTYLEEAEETWPY